MFLDKGLQVANAQAVTATAPSQDFVDTVKRGSVVSADGYFIVTCNESAAATGAATVNFQLQSADDATFSTNLTTHVDSGAVAKTELVKDKYMLKIKAPVHMRRFVRVNFVVGTGPLTAGKFSVNFAPDVPVDING